MRQGCFASSVALAAWAMARVVTAQSLPSTTPIDAWGPNGEVRAMARAGDTLYLGGDFTYVGPATGPLALFDAATGAPVGTGANLTGRVSQVVAIPGGGWIVLGDVSAPGRFFMQAAKLDASGTFDPAWFVSVSGLLTFVQADATTVYLGGSFTHVNGTPRSGLAAVDVGTGSVLPWNPLVSDGAFPPLVEQGLLHQGTLFLRGRFSIVNGLAADGFAALDAASGTTRSVSAAPVTEVRTMAVAGGNAYVVGNDAMFAQVGAVVSATSGASTPWNVPSVFVQRIVATSQRVFALTSSAQVIALDPVTGAQVGPPIEAGGSGFFSGMAAGSAALYLARESFATGGRVADVVAVPLATLGAPSWTVLAGAAVDAIAEDSAGRVALAGDFQSVGGTARSRLAGIDLRTGRPTSFTPGVRVDDLRALTTVGNVVVAGGQFRTTPSSPAVAMVAMDGVNGQPLAWSPIRSGTVDALATDGRSLFVGGSFGLVDGVSRPFLAAVGLATGRVTDWLPVPDDVVTALDVSSGSLLATGRFTALAAGAFSGGAAFDIESGAALAWNPATDGPVLDVAGADGRIAIVGGFLSAQGGFARGFAVFDAAGIRLPIVAPPRFTGGVSVISGLGQAFLIGGRGPATDSPVAIVSAVTGADLGWSPMVGDVMLLGSVSRLAWFPDAAVVAGRFAVAGGVRVNNLAIFRTAGPPPPVRVRVRVSGNALTMGWEAAPGSTPTSFVLDASSGGQPVGSFPIAGTSFSVTAPAGTYSLRLRAVDASVAGAVATAPIPVVVPAPPQAPDAPSALSATVTAGVVSLTWSRATGGGNVESFVIEAGSGPGLANIAAVDTGIVDAQFSSSAPPGTYHLRVRAKNEFGVSLPSNDVTIVVP